MDYLATYQLDTLSLETPVQADSVQERPVWEQQAVSLSYDSDYLLPLTDQDVVLSTVQKPPRPIMPVYEKTSLNSDWLTVILFAALLIFASIRYSYVAYIKHLFTSLINYPTSLRLLQESNYPASHAAYRLDVVFYICFSVFAYQSLSVLGVEGSGNQLLFYVIILAGVLVYYLVKRFIYQSLGTLFETVHESGEYLFNMSNYNRALGIVLIPMIALVSYSPVENAQIMVFTGVSIIVAFHLLLLWRGLIILLRKQFSILYLFLYLCTLEFLPLLLIYKVVVVE